MGRNMSYTSIGYYLLLAVILLAYYIVPGRIRWTVLLAGSLYFYWLLTGSPLLMGAFGAMILISYAFGLLIGRTRSKIALAAGIILSAAPLVTSKLLEIASTSIPGTGSAQDVLSKAGPAFPARLLSGAGLLSGGGLALPVGASFFTLQMIAYLADVYQGKVSAQKDPFRYALFISFFPQIIQGPIPRYAQLADQLFVPHKLSERNIMKGFHLIVWGFFLKFMIADKAGIIVDTVFSKPEVYKGMYVFVAGCLYSIQLYTDFMSCVFLSRGAARFMGIDVIDNFAQPYLAVSIRDFWRRWHISLSAWLRDYIYIPLGGSRRGKLFKYVNLTLTFIVSGIWHGGSVKFIFWGLLHAFYQIAGEFTIKARDKGYALLRIEKNSYLWHIIKSAGTFLLVMPAWIIFRARDLGTGLRMILSMATVHNYWIFWNNTLYTLGLGWKEWSVLKHSIIVLLAVSCLRTKYSLSDMIMKQHLIVRWTILIGAILLIMIYGTYGFGYDAKAFIYGGF